MIECGSKACTAKYADLRFAQQILRSEVCTRDPRIISQSSDLRFAQQNPRMVRIRTLRLTSIFVGGYEKTDRKTKSRKNRFLLCSKINA